MSNGVEIPVKYQKLIKNLITKLTKFLIKNLKNEALITDSFGKINAFVGSIIKNKVIAKNSSCGQLLSKFKLNKSVSGSDCAKINRIFNEKMKSFNKTVSPYNLKLPRSSYFELRHSREMREEKEKFKIKELSYLNQIFEMKKEIEEFRQNNVIFCDDNTIRAVSLFPVLNKTEEEKLNKEVPPNKIISRYKEMYGKTFSEFSKFNSINVNKAKNISFTKTRNYNELMKKENKLKNKGNNLLNNSNKEYLLKNYRELKDYVSG